MTSLITRLRELKGPDRDVDIAILRLVRPEQDKYCYALAQNLKEQARANGLTSRDDACERSAYAGCPAYTASIDAALTLVPEGMAATVGQNVHHSYWGAHVLKLNEDGFPETAGYSGPRSTPAIALCIAALQARGVK